MSNPTDPGKAALPNKPTPRDKIRDDRPEVAMYMGGPLEFVHLFESEAEVLTAIAKMRAWLREDSHLFLPYARRQAASQLWSAREQLRFLREQKPFA